MMFLNRLKALEEYLLKNLKMIVVFQMLVNKIQMILKKILMLIKMIWIKLKTEIQWQFIVNTMLVMSMDQFKNWEHLTQF
jgi:hypothetical protein